MAENGAVLVTGGAGYIGSHVCKALAGAGYLPIAFDNMVYGHEWAVKWGPLEVGDICDATRLAEVITEWQPVAVVHLAAYAYVGESVEDPENYYCNNLGGMLSLLSAVREAGIRRFVFSSSCVVYGEPEQVPITEVHACNPVNPYGVTKYAGERMLRDFVAAYGGASVSLRYFNAAGADPDGEVGEVHDPEPHLIPRVLDVALGHEKQLTVYGDDYDTPDGSCVRDYVHVTDLAEGHARALGLMAGEDTQRVYNLGAGLGVSVMELIEAARQITGADIPFVVGDRRPGDPARLVADTGLAERELGWAPRYSDLEDIIGTAWRWTNR